MLDLTNCRDEIEIHPSTNRIDGKNDWRIQIWMLLMLSNFKADWSYLPQRPFVICKNLMMDMKDFRYKLFRNIVKYRGFVFVPTLNAIIMWCVMLHLFFGVFIHSTLNAFNNVSPSIYWIEGSNIILLETRDPSNGCHIQSYSKPLT